MPLGALDFRWGGKLEHPLSILVFGGKIFLHGRLSWEGKGNLSQISYKPSLDLKDALL